MSVDPPKDHLLACDKIRIGDLQKAKNLQQRWPMLTCYDATSAKIFELARIPVLLVGDSAAQAVLGHKSTIPITVDEMIPMVRAVAGSCQRALVIADLPFGSYQEGPQAALKNATRFMKEAGAHGVKLEGGAAYEEHVRLLTTAGIPVMAHVGLTPQSEHMLSGYKVQGRDVAQKQTILEDAQSLQAAGAFACVLELVPPDVGRLLATQLKIPVVGIGAGPDTDAQVLVWTDMAGYSPPRGTSRSYLGDSEPACHLPDLQSTKQSTKNSERCGKDMAKIELNKVPKFVKRYANMSEILYNAAGEFYNDVALGIYPGPEHCYQ